MNKKDLEQLLKQITQAQVAVIGDFCLDVYWQVESSISELSVETNVRTTPVVEQRFSLGGAGNVAQNLCALGAKVSIFGVIGDDPFGRQMLQVADTLGIQTEGLLLQQTDWDTHAYIKPMENGVEASRIDFGRKNALQNKTADALISAIESALPRLDAIAVNQQIPDVLHNAYFIKKLNALMQAHPNKIFILDGRDVAEQYPHCWHKMNDFEACRLHGFGYAPLDDIPASDASASALALYGQWQQPLIVSRGANGAVVVDEEGSHEVLGIQLGGPIDSVGAGDSLLAGICAAAACGSNAYTAAQLGNLVAAVTVQKCAQTGTASPDELLALLSSAHYNYHLDKSIDIRSAQYWQDSEIEIVEDLPEQLNIRHIIFDHDGTLSVMREGWEDVMEPVMIKAILGSHYSTIDQQQLQDVRERVVQFIDDSTGIQTLVQMQGLVELVRSYGFVPADEVLDEHGYKEIYNDALMAVVNQRMQKLQAEELSAYDFAIKGAHDFLQHCYDQGIKLYLASGTDEADVITEAKAMGYADLFEGRIYGAVGDVTKEAKRMVMQRILTDIGEQHASQVMAIGDGPVEIREMRKRGGLCVGIASDEKRKFSLNPAKRTRLIRAGAHVVISDYSQADLLYQCLQISATQVEV